MWIHHDLTRTLIGAAIDVHRTLGPGLLESVYQACLEAELGARGLAFRAQAPVPLRYRGVTIDCAFRLDLLVEDRLVVEIKAVETLLAVHEAQLLTYLRLAECRLGLLINFNVPTLRDGIIRRIL